MRTSFDFGEDVFSYGIGDVGGMRGQLVAYEALDVMHPGEFTIGNGIYLSRFAVIPVAFGAGFWLVSQAGMTGPLPVWLLGLAGLSAAVLGYAMLTDRSAVAFTEVPTFGAADGVRGFVRIIRDGQHDAIVAELRRRWRQRLRTLYAAPDPASDPAREAAKFDKLLEAEVITPDEHARALAQVRALAGADRATPPPVRH